MLTHAGIGLSEVTVEGDSVYWVESRPTEAGRSVVVRRRPDGAVEDVVPPGFNARTRAHEYGGGTFAVRNGVVIASSFEDQRVYRLDEADPHPITPKPELPAGDRYADFVFHDDLVIAIRERHRTDGEAVNQLVVFPADGSAPPRVIAGGRDFVSSPRVSPDGDRLAWLTWDHPRMPWDGTELWVADRAADGTLADARPVAGGPTESIFQPEWSPTGILHFASDRTGWWNLYRMEADGVQTAVHTAEAEFGAPHWQFGYRTYGFLDDGSIAAVYRRDGRSFLARLEDGASEKVPMRRDSIPSWLAVGSGRVWLVASAPTLAPAVVGIDPRGGEELVARTALTAEIDPRYVSHPEAVEFPTTGDEVAHAFFYPPTNPDYTGPQSALPPLVVWTHGGPTGAVSSGFNPGLQFWTSRGFAVVDVNYRGSVGYGRRYRNALRGRWGIIDTEDCIAAARYLADQGRVDGGRLAIRGGSAGGYTTLCALTFHDEFAAGTSYFGVSDLEGLAIGTHKFESRYLDSLVGPYPEAVAAYHERSPIHHTELLSRPMLILQGLDDKVVLPFQAEMIVEALARKGVPHAYLAFEGEGHGFRKAETIERAVEAELSFYGWVFGFTPAGEIRPIEIHGA